MKMKARSAAKIGLKIAHVPADEDQHNICDLGQVFNREATMFANQFLYTAVVIFTAKTPQFFIFIKE